MRLSQLLKGATAIIDTVTNVQAIDPIADRLRDLGFVAGEQVRVVATSPWGGSPVLVKIGTTRFALRLAEAERIHLLPLETAA